jgi:hypothetical protein
MEWPHRGNGRIAANEIGPGAFVIEKPTAAPAGLNGGSPRPSVGWVKSRAGHDRMVSDSGGKQCFPALFLLSPALYPALYLLHPCSLK